MFFFGLCSHAIVAFLCYDVFEGASLLESLRLLFRVLCLCPVPPGLSVCWLGGCAGLQSVVYVGACCRFLPFHFVFIVVLCVVVCIVLFVRLNSSFLGGFYGLLFVCILFVCLCFVFLLFFFIFFFSLDTLDHFPLFLPLISGWV